MGLVEALVNVIVAIVKLTIGVTFAVIAVHLGLKLFEKVTQIGSMKKLNIQHELEEGNAAVAIFMIGVVIAIAIVIRSGIASLSQLGEFNGFTIDFFLPIMAGFVQMLLAVVLAVLSIYISLWVLQRFMKGMDIIENIHSGNIAMAIAMAGIIISVAFVIEIAVAGISPF